MNILVQLSHPAHFHLYKNSILNWESNGHNVFVLIKTKDILEDLLKNAGIKYYNILPIAHRKNRLGILWDMVVRDFKIAAFVLKNHIDLLTGSTVEVAHVAWILHKESVNTGEDDAAAVPAFTKAVGPTIQTLLTPIVCDNGKNNSKSIKYNSYHELAYLHSNHFSPDLKIAAKYSLSDKPYFILRFAQLKAYHDIDVKAHGINTEIAQHLIDQLVPYGEVLITSERELEPQFEKYRININPLDIHHVIAFSQMYIGDSQTMAAEAGVLGIPFIRFNDFVGRIGYLKELEDDYKLGYGIKTKDINLLYQKVDELLNMPDRKDVFQLRRQKMLSEKIDYAKFLTWFIENYPESRKTMKENPDYQYNFR